MLLNGQAPPAVQQQVETVIHRTHLAEDVQRC
jgi:hypothetical protein